MSELTIQQMQHTRNKILEGISEFGGNIRKACELAGCAPSTYYRYLKEDSEFKTIALQATYEAKEKRLDEIHDSLYQQAIGDKPNVIAGIFMAKALSRSSQDPSKVMTDAPPVETIAIEQDDTPSLTDTNQEQIKAMMDKYITTLKTTTPSAEQAPQ